MKKKLKLLFNTLVLFTILIIIDQTNTNRNEMMKILAIIKKYDNAFFSETTRLRLDPRKPP